MRTITFLLLLFTTAVSAQTFKNPLLPSGPDPWCTYRNGYYYYMHTMGDRLELWKTKNMGLLKDAEHKTIWMPPSSGPYSRNIWAPEILFLRGKWYVYFAADNGDNRQHRIYALENSAADPMTGKWEFKGKVADEEDKWAIDGSVFEHRGQLYMVWSGWPGNRNGQQDIYIAAMKDPLTITGKRVRISTALYSWEKHGDVNDPDTRHVNVNEGPEILPYGNKLYLIYSASGCWTEHYTLGMLEISANANLLDAKQWKKWPRPVFLPAPEKQSICTGT